VLAALIQLYVERREPISSRLLEERGSLSIKSASIRSVLAELEKKGYLTHAHTSAGRVPTDEGYRVFVDAYLGAEAIEPTERIAIERALREAGRDMEGIVRATAAVLGRFSRNIAILAGPRDRSPRIASIELYDRDTRHVLIVITLDDFAVRTELVELDRELRPELLAAAARFLAERLVGRSLDETRRDLERMLQPVPGEAEGMGADLVESARHLFDPASLLQLSFEGVQQALEQPEFADPGQLRALLHLMSGAQAFERALEDFVRAEAGQVSIAIGAENRLPELHPFSVLATRFELDDRYGYLAVLGPRRMHYARLHALVRLVASHLESLRVTGLS
jgi:heat-inducible transcriptional repressor